MRTLGESADDEGKILALIKSIKENLDVKMIALRKDLDRQTHDELFREVSKIQNEIEKLASNSEDSKVILLAKIAGFGESIMEKVDAKIASLKSDIEAKENDHAERFASLKSDIDAKESEHAAVDIARIQEEVEAGRTNGELARAALSARIEGLAVKVDAIAAAPAEEAARIKQSVEASLKQVQALVSSFDLPAFVNEIRQLYAEKLSQAEEKLKALAAQLAKVEQENEQLKKALGEKELQLKKSPPPSTAPAPRPDTSQATPERAPRVRSPRAPVQDLQPDPAVIAEIPLPEHIARRRATAFCVNCGKPRPGLHASYCIFCGTAFP